MPWIPLPYMRQAVKFLLGRNSAALFLDPGLAKTAISLAAFKLLKRRNLASKALVVAPLRVCYTTWPQELQKWTDFHELKAVLLHGPKKAQRLLEEADLYLINPEGLMWLFGAVKTKLDAGRSKVEPNVARFRRLEFDLLIVDELTRFKHPKTDYCRAMKPLLATFPRRWGLTGSPSANGLMDLFGQVYTLDLGRSFGPYITHFRRTYFDQGYQSYTWALKPGAEAQIYERLKPLALRMAAEDYLQMPPKLTNDIHVELPAAALKTYLTFERDLLAQITNRTISAGGAGAASTKCRQLAGGGVYLDQDVEVLAKLPKVGKRREWAEVHSAKLDALADLLDELQGTPALIAYEFNHELERFRARFGKHIAVIGGDTRAAMTAQHIQAWNDGQLPYIFAHPRAAAHGLDGLQQRGRHIIWYSLTWDYELYDQFIRRLWRQGSQASRVVVHRLLARGTIDEEVVMALNAKHHGQQALFNALKAKAKKSYN